MPLTLTVAGLLYLPGIMIVLAAGRRKCNEVLALAPVSAVALAGVDGIVLYPMHIRWNWASYLASAIVLAALCGLARTWMAKRGTKDKSGNRAQSRSAFAIQKPESDDKGFLRSACKSLPAASGIILAAGTIAGRLIEAVPSPEQVTQNYDSVFHENIVARIAMTGQASSLHALPPVRDVYPIAFQQFAALGNEIFSQTSTSSSVTCTWLIFAALVWPISMLYMVRSLVGPLPATDFLAPALSAATAGFPFLLLDWGTLYSMFASQVLLPVFLGLVWRYCRGSMRGERESWTRLAWMAVSVLAISVCHFRVMMTALLLAFPEILVWFIGTCSRLRQHNRAAFRATAAGFVAAIAAVAIAGVAIFRKMYLSGASRPIADHLNGGPAQPTESIGSATLRYFLGQPINSSNQRLPVFWPIAIALIAAVAIIVIEHKPQGLTLLSSFLLLGFVFVSCAGSHADWAKVVTALWYKDQRRLFAAWPIAGIALISWAISAATRWLRLRNSLAVPQGGRGLERAGTVGARSQRRTAVTVAAVTLIGLLSCLVNPQMRAMQSAVSRTYAFADNYADSPMLSSDEYLLLKRLDRHVGPSEEVVSDPWNGSGFMLAVGHRTPYYAHLSSMWDYDHEYLARHFDRVDSDPQVCRILKNNDLKWYVDMGGPYVKNDPQHQVFEGLRPVLGAMHPVDRQGRAMLYRITACGL